MLLAVFDNLLELVEKFLVLVLLPGVVSLFDALLHLLEGLLEHLGEARVHLLNVLVQLLDLLVLAPRLVHVVIVIKQIAHSLKLLLVDQIDVGENSVLCSRILGHGLEARSAAHYV